MRCSRWCRVLGLISIILFGCTPEGRPSPIPPEAPTSGADVILGTPTSTRRSTYTPQPSPTPTATLIPLASLPDGIYLATIAEAGFGSELRIRTVEGELLGILAYYRGDSPELSPGGQTLVFYSQYRPSGDRPILMQLPQGTSRPLDCADFYCGGFSWDPRGSRVACSSDVGTIEGQEDWGSIFVLAADQCDATRMTYSWASESSPAWSPDGRYIAYDSDQHEGHPGFTDIYMVDVSCLDAPATCDGRARRLTHDAPGNYSFAPAWSPDSTTIVYECSGDRARDLCLVDVASLRTIRILDTPQLDETSPRWSPDGQWIAFTSWPDSSWKQHPCIVRPDGTAYTCLQGPENEEFAFWLQIPQPPQ